MTETPMTNQFDEIRPYFDHEIQTVCRRLQSHPDIIQAIIAFFFKKYPKWLHPFFRFCIHQYLQYTFRNTTSVSKFQHKLKPYLHFIFKKTTLYINPVNVENLKPQTPYLFLSTHREILLDPIILNYILFSNNLETTRIAIGDNLLSKTYIKDLMRVNKSFIVKRSSKTRREKLENIKQLSQYIKHSIETNHSIWLAHREGRTKDGHDKTASALIKMLWMAHREKSVPELMHDLNVIPVSISYEINPCDYLIAQEMYLTKKEGAYKKKPDEDLNSMLEGVLKNKGRIIVTFGQPLHEIPYLTDLASSIQNIDQQIHQNYTLFPIHYVAYHKLYGHEIAPLFQTTHYSINDQKQGEALLNERLALCSPETESFLLAQYANPVKNFIESKTTQCSSSPV